MAKEEVKESQYQVVQVPESYLIRIQTPAEELLTIEQALADILNKLNELTKKL